MQDAASDRRAGTVVVGIDPGRRVGVAWVDAEGALLDLAVVAPGDLADLELPVGAQVVVGDGTGSREARAALRARGVDPQLVDERHTSEEGRRLAWRVRPPRGWRRWLPEGLRPPPADLDAFAAYAIARRWLALAEPTAVAATANQTGR